MKEKESGTKYQETKQHGSRLFPFNIYPCTIPLDFPAVPLHWHKEMELIYIKKGKGLIQIETKSFEGEPGDIFVVTPGTLHAIHRIKDILWNTKILSLKWIFWRRSSRSLCRRISRPACSR
mgnify:CR=1 FL=1